MNKQSLTSNSNVTQSNNTIFGCMLLQDYKT